MSDSSGQPPRSLWTVVVIVGIVGLVLWNWLFPPLVDIDRMAARMKTHQEQYRQFRDESFAAYDKLHPGWNPAGRKAKAAISIGLYLWLWGDVYGEGLPAKLLTYLSEAQDAGISDPLLVSLNDIHRYESEMTTTEHDFSLLDQKAQALEATDYPVCFKFWCEVTEANVLVRMKKIGDGARRCRNGSPCCPTSSANAASVLSSWS